MAKKSYSVTVDETIVTAFKDMCKEQNINQSQVILLGYEQQRRKSQPS